MKKLYYILVISATVFAGFFGSIADAQAPVQQKKINVIEFYRETCAHCQAIKPYLNDIEKKYKDQIVLKRYEVEVDAVARDLFLRFLDAYAIPRGEGGVPVLFIGDKYFFGDEPIRQGFEPALAYALANGSKLNDNLDAAIGGFVDLPAEELPTPVSDRGRVGLALIMGTAAIDSVNPCAIAVLLFLIAFLLAIKASRKRLVLLGGVYIFGVFVTYLLAGIGLLKFVTIFNLAPALKWITAAILLFGGLISIKDYFWYGKGISLKIPERAKPIITKYLQTATVPAVFIAGILVSAFELPCTGEVYLGIISMMAQSSGASKAIGFTYLAIYNIIFVLPLILILLAAVFGLKIDRIEQVRAERKKWLRLLIGIGMLFLAYWVLR